MSNLWSNGRKIGKVVGVLMLGIFLGIGCGVKSKETSQPLNNGVATEDVKSQVTSETQTRVEVMPTIHSIRMAPSKADRKIQILGTGKLAYTAIKQSFPFGVVVYLPNTRILPELLEQQVKVLDPVSGVRVSYADTRENTAKIEIRLNEDVPYEIAELDKALDFVLLDTNSQVAESEAVETSTTHSLAESLIHSGGALVTDLQLNTDDKGRSDIRVETDQPVEYATSWESDTQVNLWLKNTKIPSQHKHLLPASYSNSPIESISSVEQGAGEGDSKISILLKEKVPFQVLQEEGQLSLTFEPSLHASSTLGKGFETAGYRHSAHGGMDSSAGAGKKKYPAMAKPRPKYTGEKIKLDFYETDIKNVFRILRSVSGKNFAVDKNVTGSVTLTLDKPVPWDQVLDLVLKMNGLGKKYENNVIRIATLDTLKREEQNLQELLKARKKAIDQQKSLEPLFTEYIPINYSDAAANIQPNITPLLTENRGKISVDKRTNLIIVTDTRGKINQIRDMIYRLDTVTPQIMIEAKIVEVTKRFSRSIGLGLTVADDSTVTAGFANDYNVSVNQPSGNGVSTDISFFRIFGSSRAALNARLEASEENGTVRIVSSPRILTLDHKTAKIKQGVEYAYLERDDSGGSSVRFKDIDLLLEVTPHVTPDQRISMTLMLTKNDISSITSSGAPTLSTNEAETELLVNNHETVVIGGIVKSRTNQDNKSLPFLSQVPLLNTLFGTDLKEEDRNELLIFLTPTIVQLEQKRAVMPAMN